MSTKFFSSGGLLVGPCAVEIVGQFTEGQARDLARAINGELLESADTDSSSSGSGSADDDSSNTARILIVGGTLLVIAAGGWFIARARRSRQAAERTASATMGGYTLPGNTGTTVTQTTTDEFVVGTNEEG